MGINIGPGISVGPGISIGNSTSNFVTSGLILNLDAANYSGSGISWLDSSGNSNDFTLIGDTPWTSAGTLSYFTFSGGIAQGGAILPNTAYTKLAIFRVYGGFGNIISGGVSDYDHAFWGGGTPYLTAGHNGNWYYISTNPNPVPTGQWVFGAVTFNTSDGWRLYLNTDAAIIGYDTTPFNPNPSIVQIGGFAGNANNFGGDIALALCYNRVLSGAEIAQLYSYYQARFSLT